MATNYDSFFYLLQFKLQLKSIRKNVLIYWLQNIHKNIQVDKKYKCIENTITK